MGRSCFFVAAGGGVEVCTHAHIICLSERSEARGMAERWAGEGVTCKRPKITAYRKHSGESKVVTQENIAE